MARIMKLKVKCLTLRLIRKIQNQPGNLLTNFKNSRNVSSHKTISNIRVGEETINTHKEVAETFNSHFASVGENLASDIPLSTVEPDVCVVPAKTMHIFNEIPHCICSLQKTKSN